MLSLQDPRTAGSQRQLLPVVAVTTALSIVTEEYRYRWGAKTIHLGNTNVQLMVDKTFVITGLPETGNAEPDRREFADFWAF